ncbi:carbohydrate-binding module family 48 protein [Tulasnella calospora MUT 4182]|uniref:Carbohydrate-binding module family 48 protein n=1 Tax=Tulasnella calospora MUT 4182 TaxID=1051891 RepID=A0A0C3L9G3_9AGAM|nr:carbohydrate-binding module family 48 protein [Tulasnella calospora MUT 4182]
MSTYDAEFYWFGPANEVTLTGSFDNWARSVHMEKTLAGFSAKVKLPYGQKVDYKYVVDGQWAVNEDFPTTYDWQGNINNYIITPNEPEPVPELPKALPTPPPELVIKAPSSPANDGPVTPINLPAPVAAVTPMEVPPSAVSPHPDLSVDPIVGRSIVESIVAATKPEETPKEEKAEEIVQAAVVDETKVEAPKPAEPKAEESKAEESKAEEPAPVTVLASTIVASPSEISVNPSAESTQPSTNDVKPEVVVTQAEPVALDSPVKPATPTLPESKPATETSAAPPAPTAVPLPETPAVTPAAEKQPEVASHFSTTTEGTKPEAPVTPKKSEGSGTVRRGSTRVFSFGRASNDSASETSTTKSPKTPGTPGSSKGTETKRKKRTSFMTKVHDLFHPHHKEEREKA